MAVAITHQPAVKQAKLPTVPTGKKKKSMNDKKKIRQDSQETPRTSGSTTLPASSFTVSVLMSASSGCCAFALSRRGRIHSVFMELKVLSEDH